MVSRTLHAFGDAPKSSVRMKEKEQKAGVRGQSRHTYVSKPGIDVIVGAFYLEAETLRAKLVSHHISNAKAFRAQLDQSKLPDPFRGQSIVFQEADFFPG